MALEGIRKGRIRGVTKVNRGRVAPVRTPYQTYGAKIGAGSASRQRATWMTKRARGSAIAAGKKKGIRRFYQPLNKRGK